MVTVLSNRFRFIFLFLVTFAGLVTAPAACANAVDSITACFHFLDAQDYARAESEAKSLLQSPSLERTEQRYAHLCLGRTYRSMGRAQDALPAFLQVEALSQTTEELAVAYGFLGVTYLHLNDLDRAELYDQRSIKAFRKMGDKSGESDCLSNLADVMQSRGDLERALALYQEALALEPDKVKISTLGNIAGIYADRKEYAKAVKMLKQAIEIGRRNGDTHSATQLQLKLGNTLLKHGKLKEAEKELTAGLNAIRLVGDKYWEAEACWSLADLAVAQKKIPLAREWYGKAEALYREIGDMASADDIAANVAALGK